MIAPKFFDLGEIKELFPKDFKITGIGVTAFPRAAIGYLLPSYEVLSLLETADLESIRKVFPVVSLEKDLKAKLPEKFNTSEMLQLPEAKKYLSQKQALFLYKASKKSNRLAEEMGVKVLSTPGEIRSVYENKKEFRVEGKKAGINIIAGETLLVDDLTESKWQEYRQSLGEELVFQLPDYTVGGGLGTFFIREREDFLRFKDFVKRRREVREIEIVNVTKLIKGETSSMTGCATKFGVVTGKLQKQVMDQPELAALHGRDGVWLGHDWQVEFSEKAQAEAEALVKKWGEYIYKHGYKGIFGLDVMVDENDRVWPVECNARYTGAFPVYTMMQIAQGEMPIDVWHLLEWLGVDYEMNIDEVQKMSRQPKKGAHLLLHNMERRHVTPTKTIKAGVYKMENGKAEWIRDGFSLLDIQSEDEWVLCDKIPTEEAVLKPAERVGRLMFKRRVMGDDNRLLPEIKKVVKAMYDKFELAVVETPEGY